MNLSQSLTNQPRLLMEIDLRPAQGSRFQPTGFPDLGAATYNLHDGTQMLLVESAQSMANRLENTCWDEGAGDLREELRGLPYVRVALPDGNTTNSILEAHRLNSPYIVNSPQFEKIKADIGFEKSAPLNRPSFVTALLKYDLNSLIHGVFLEKVGGVLRTPRAISGFIEAKNVTVAPAGGVKFDRVQPDTQGTGKTNYGKAEEGYGNVPFHRDEFTGEITGFFNLDLALLRGFGFDDEVFELLVTLSLYKVQRFLRDGLRLRTACDLMPAGPLRITAPEGIELPSLGQLTERLPALIEACSQHFADPVVTDVTYSK